MATTKRTVEVALATSGIGPDGRPQRTPLVVDDGGNVVALDAPPAVEPDVSSEHMLINIGPHIGGARNGEHDRRGRQRVRS